jgi:peroxiredoxin
VLLFFPFAFTGVCTKEMCDVTGGLDAYARLDAAVFGISVDSPHAQFAWAQQERIGVALLSDLNKYVTRAYDVVFDGPAGTYSARAAFVIGKDGVIKHSERTPTPKDLPDFAAINAALAAT